MPEKLTASVGRLGRNLEPDVRKVQRLLNRVPYAEGGPYVSLRQDGLCGPKTTEAIQKFQLHHFGWKGADGKVDPNGQTLAKLNEFDSRPLVGQTFRIRSVRRPGQRLRPSNAQDWFFRIEMIPHFYYDVDNFPRAIYWFGRAGSAPKLAPTVFQGRDSVFRTKSPKTIDELAGSGKYVSRFPSYGRWPWSTLFVDTMGPKGADLPNHLDVDGDRSGRIQRRGNDGGWNVFELAGRMQFVKRLGGAKSPALPFTA